MIELPYDAHTFDRTIGLPWNLCLWV